MINLPISGCPYCWFPAGQDLILKAIQPPLEHTDNVISHVLQVTDGQRGLFAFVIHDDHFLVAVAAIFL